ncbi:hypothetical protein [Streptomyces sp. NPDC059176]|uniref:hypothetical protein n=1 Tax=unclassified Streptomyces TaxID=2593676 RepID=UPI0036BB8F32
MAGMRRGLVHAMAWSLATGAAVTFSWWGVHTVMAGTAYDPPRALPITTDNRTTQGSPSRASSTPRVPSPSASASPVPEPSRTTSPSPSPERSSPGRRTSPSAPPPSGSVKSYAVEGGRVAFDIGSSDAELVSATPSPGWTMQVWKQPTWIRVTFSRDGHENDVFCTWNDHPPLVQIEER